MLLKEVKDKMLAIDCPPGEPRPSYFLPEVIAGTPLRKRSAESKLMGMWTWFFDDVDDATWCQAIAIIGPRLRSLYRRRMIRGAVLSGYNFGGEIVPDVLA